MNTNKKPPVPNLDTENRHQKEKIRPRKNENVAKLDGDMQIATQPHKLCYRLKEAAPMIGVSYHTLWRLIERGEIKSIRKTRTHLIPRAELERWVRESAS